MIFIFEQQKTLNYLGETPYMAIPVYEKANMIFKALNLLDLEELELINEVHYLTDEEMNTDLYKPIFEKYLADINSYSFDIDIVWEISHLFPDLDELNDQPKQKRIEFLINNLSIYTVSSSRECKNYINLIEHERDTCLLYLPYCSTISFRLMKELRASNVKLFSDKKFLKGRSYKERIFIDVPEFLRIKDELDKVNPTIRRHERGSNYQVKEFIGNFGDEFLKKVIDFQFSSKNKLHIFGNDMFVTKRVIDKILANRDRYYYYLPQDLYAVESRDKSVVVFNLERLGQSEEYKFLSDKLDSINRAYKIIQALRKINVQYFRNFEDFEVPSLESYENFITGIFIGLLLESGTYCGNLRKLGSFYGNILKNLIPKAETLEVISEAIEDFKDLEFSDLRDNAGFWYYLNLRSKEISSHIKSSETQKLKQKVTIERTKKDWKIFIWGNVLEEKSIGILYLLVIMEYSRQYQKAIDSVQIQELAYKYLGKSLERPSSVDENPMESSRKTISSTLSLLRKDDSLKRFIYEYFSFSAKRNYFNPKDEIEIEIIDPTLENLISTL